MAEFGSLVSDPGMWDEVLKKIVAQMQVEPDRKMPLNQGLMAAGLGMLANSHKGFAGAAGEGGLLGLNAWQQGLQAQKRDPMQQLQMLQAVSGMQERQNDARLQRQFQADIAGQPQYSPQMGPPADRAPNFAGPPADAAPMTQGIPSMQVLEKYLLNPKTAAWAAPLIKHYYPEAKLGMGDVLMRGGQTLASNPDPTKPVIGLDGGVSYRPGFAEEEARREGLKAAATEAAKLQNSIVTLSREGGPPEQMMGDAAAAALRGQAPQQQAAPTKPQIAPELSDADLKAIDDIARRTGARFQITTQPAPGRLGVGQTEAQKAAALIPGKVAEAKALAEATNPLTLDQKYNEGVQAQNLKFRETINNEAATARTQQAQVNRFMQLNNDPNVAQGRLAESVSGFKNVAASFGMDIKGLPAEQAMQSISGQMALTLRNPDSGMGMPGAMSDADREFLKSMSPNLNQTKEGRKLIAQAYNAFNERKLEIQRMMIQHENKGGKFDGAFLKKIADYADANPLFAKQQRVAEMGDMRERLEAEMRRRGILK